MKRILHSTALSTALALGLTAAAATAASAEAQAGIFMPALAGQEVTASGLIGMRVYVPETVNANLVEVAGLNDGWNDVGEVHDLILSRDGQVRAVLIDIGGFLGMGEHSVAVDMGALRFVSDSSTEDDPDDFFLVLNTPVEALQAAPVFDPESRTFHAMADQEGATGHAGIMRPGYVSLAHDELTAEDITGMRVYDAKDEWIGEVSGLIVSTDGKLEKAVIDVGGFLGIGEKPVALPMDQVQILREENGNDMRIYVDMTKAQLEALPSWEG